MIIFIKTKEGRDRAGWVGAILRDRTYPKKEHRHHGKNDAYKPDKMIANLSMNN